VATGVLATLILSKVTEVNYNYFELIPGAILGSTMPDVDTAKSWASQAIPFVDDSLRKLGIFKHRGLTHGITGIIGILIIYFFIQNTFMLGFAIGYISHCLLDSLTKVLKITTKSDKIVYNIVWITIVIMIFVMPFIDIDLLKSFEIDFSKFIKN
jgi:membrane-bound metal-dependent hydrolase YbcI (DUF457 family)